MFKTDRHGNIAFKPSTLVGIAVLVFGFGSWMGLMQRDVSKISSLVAKVDRVERILISEGLDHISRKGPPWPVPSPYSAYLYASLPLPGAGIKRE